MKPKPDVDLAVWISVLVAVAAMLLAIDYASAKLKGPHANASDAAAP